MIPMDQLTILQPSSAVKACADSAYKEHIEASLAYTINYAANCGQHEVLWQHKLSDDMKSLLEQNGYKVRQQTNSAHRDRLWVISWK